jgi:type IV pilus assembly protein PilO
MANVRDVRQKLRIAMAVLVGLNVLAAGALLYMMVRGTSQLPAEFHALHQQVQNKKSAIIPPETVKERVKEAREQIAHFYEDRFPNSSAAIFETLGKVASENHVRLNQATYNVTEEDAPGVRQIVITASLNGNYVEAMKFINALERDKMFFIVDNVALGDQQGGNVRLNIRIETYMRGEA